MMNEKDMQNIAIAAQYGTCGTKYLGEILDQLRIQGLDKQDMSYAGYGIAKHCASVECQHERRPIPALDELYA